MEDVWHCVNLKSQDSMRCFSFVSTYTINCSAIINIGQVKKGYHCFGFKINFKDRHLTNSHFETEIDHDFSIFIYPFLSRASAECERMEIKFILNELKRRREILVRGEKKYKRKAKVK